MATHLRVLAGLYLLSVLPSVAGAQFIEWRVSVKFILDASGQRGLCAGDSPFFQTDASVRAEIDEANAILASWGHGHRLVLTEIVDLPGVSQWFCVEARNGQSRTDLENAAEADPGTYALRNDAINIYINGHNSSGSCSRPGSGFQIILLGQGGYRTIMIHEIGHFFDLCHTQGCPCNGCNEGPAMCQSGAVHDDIVDTLLDRACWSRDDIAQQNFGNNYENLAPGQRVQVDGTWQNVMSYHIQHPQRFTLGQVDKLVLTSNLTRNAVASGFTRFVASQGDDARDGLRPETALRTIAGGVARAGPADQLWVTVGYYPENITIAERIVIRARGGAVLIGTATAP